MIVIVAWSVGITRMFGRILRRVLLEASFELPALLLLIALLHEMLVVPKNIVVIVVFQLIKEFPVLLLLLADLQVVLQINHLLFIFWNGRG